MPVLPAVVTLDSVLRAVELAAGIARRYYGSIDAASRLKADASIVTQADIEINLLLKEELLSLLPQAGWLSEEEADGPARLDREFVWIVDPLDGTKEFARGIPETAVSVGLTQGGRPVLGVVINPIRNEGGAASIWQAPQFWGLTRRPTNHSLETMAVCVSRTEYETGRVAAHSARLKSLTPIGSVAYKLLRVAAGAEHLYFSMEPKSEWDICGGVALLQITGDIYERFDGRPLIFNASHPRIPCGAVAGSKPATEMFLSEFATKN
jgi:myo-inositol-1(or 4)-monophosphatase